MGRDDSSHTPVMVSEALDALRPGEGGVYVDATYGRGGHALALLDRIGPGGRLVALDRDPDAAAAAARHAASEPRLDFEKSPFARLGAVVAARGLGGRVDGILFDLGVSAPQLEDPERGFSFHHDGPLDMRMDPGSGPSAAEWLARARAEEIADALWRFGDERLSRRIARAIVREREAGPLTRTAQLARIVERCVPAPPRRTGRRVHPATRTFQALRIAVNHELEELSAALEQAVEALAPGGRLVVISFHSIEDRIVKRYIRDRSRSAPDPVTGAASGGAGEVRPALVRVGGPRRPSAEEVARNPRARSAVLRAAEHAR